ncbi:CinA family nicotinamide mononucleotide deamidase-related protein, partial [candidate division KSB3 bacterium]|nr:CinA family nicotinamide mononucleotide deamidase-related protein [candidate division KSB3 bacterium]
MNAEIVVIGTELLLGQIIDTNAAYIAEQLNSIGISVLYKTTVGDNAARMQEVLRRALERVDVVLTSGGLGPTEDDLTREMAAAVTGRKLVLHPELLAQIKRIFDERQMPFKDNNKRQAYIPEGSIPIENPQGTAPGYIIEADQGILLSIPGVPREMKYLVEHTVLPYLKRKAGASHVIKYKLLKLCGIGESNVDHAIRDLIQASANPSIGLLAHLGQIDIRITAKAATPEIADELIARLEEQIRARLPHQIFGVDHETQESVIAELLRNHDLTLALAETNTGGNIGRHLLPIPGSDAVFRGGVVLTDAASVSRLLDIPPDT